MDDDSESDPDDNLSEEQLKEQYDLFINKKYEKVSQNMENFDKEKIMVVEDNTSNIFIIKQFIINLGYKKKNIIIAKNGLQCIKYFSTITTGYPFIILIDLKMPMVDGHLTIKKLREIFPDSKRCPNLVTVSASILVKDKTRCIEHGVNTFILKPIDETILRDTINKFLE